MSWLNESLNSLKGQITNFATEVLADGPAAVSSLDEHEPELENVQTQLRELSERCKHQDEEIAALRKVNEDLRKAQTASKKDQGGSDNNGGEESWFWDPPPSEAALATDPKVLQLQSEVTNLQRLLKERETEREELCRLREENASLNSSLEDLDQQHQQAMERLLTLKKELQKNFEVLKKEHEDIKSCSEHRAQEIDKLNQALLEKEAALILLRETSKSEYETLHHKYMNLEKVHNILQETTEKFQEENQELNEEIFKLQEELVKYDCEVSGAQSETVPKTKYDDLLKEVAKLKENKTSDTSLPLDDTNIDDNAKGVIKNLKDDISDLKRRLESTTVAETSSNLGRAVEVDKLVELYNKYMHLSYNKDNINSNDTNNEIYVLSKFEEAFKILHDYNKEIDDLHNDIELKMEKISKLELEIDDLNSENTYLSNDIANVSEELNKEKQKNEFLLNELTSLKNASKLQPIVEGHEDNIVKLETELEDCNRIKKTFEEEIETIKANLSEVIAEKASIQSDLNDLRTKYNEMLGQLEASRNNADFKSRLDLETDLSKANDEINKLKNDLHSAASENQKLSIDYSLVQNETVLLTQKIDELKNLLDDKELKLKKIVFLENKLDDLEKHVADVNTSKKELELDRQVIIEKIRTLATEIHSPETMKRYHETFKTSTQEVDVHISKIIEKIQHYIELEVKLTSEIDRLVQDSLLKNENAEQVNQSIEKDRCLDDLKEKNSELFELNIKLQNDIDSYKKINSEKIEELEKIETNLNKKQNEIDCLNLQLSEQKSYQSDKLVEENIIEELRCEMDNCKINISTMNEKLKDKDILLNKLNAEKEKNLEKQKELETELKNQTDVLSEYENQKSNLLRELELKESYIKELDESIKSEKFNVTNMSAIINALKETIESKDSEIERLRQETQNINNSEGLVTKNVYEKLCHEKETMQVELKDFTEKLSIKEKQLENAKSEQEVLKKTLEEAQSQLEKINTEKNELINFITLKHNENIQYHNEIQRLNQIILQHNEQMALSKEKENLDQDCAECAKIKAVLKEKDEKIMILESATASEESLRQELTNATSTIQVLTTKCEELDKNLTIQLDMVKNLLAEKSQLSDREQSLSRDLDRLRQHLADTEEAHTQELLAAETRANQCRDQLAAIENDERQRGMVYTSNSIRHQQELETYKTQLRLTERRREELAAQLAQTQAELSSSQRAAESLQSVTTQLQHEKEREVEQATLRLLGRERELMRANAELQEQARAAQARAEDAREGLRAAARLAEQLQAEAAKVQMYKQQVSELEGKLCAAEEQLAAASRTQERVDKSLVKNLLLNYLQATERSGGHRLQVLRILSTVLDFNQEESEKVGLYRQKNAGQQDSLAKEFVKFLEKESRPSTNLPNMLGLTQSSPPTSRADTPHSRKNSFIALPVPFDSSIAVQNTAHPGQTPGHQRTNSTGSGNALLQPLGQAATAEHALVLQAGVTQHRNTEGAILKNVLRDM